MSREANKMKKVLFSIWFNILIDILPIVSITIFHNIWSFAVAGSILLLHLLFLLIISVIFIIKKQFLKGMFFLLQMVTMGYILFTYLIRSLLLLAFSGTGSFGVYTDEGSVNSSMTECEYSLQISDSMFYSMMHEIHTGSPTQIKREAISSYIENKLDSLKPYRIARRGCRTYEDSVIVFRLQFNDSSYYDAEIRKQKDQFIITHFRYSHFLK